MTNMQENMMDKFDVPIWSNPEHPIQPVSRCFAHSQKPLKRKGSRSIPWFSVSF